MKNKIQTLFLLGILAFGANQASAQNLIVYPNTQAPLFSIEVPKSWVLTKAEEENQFFVVTDPDGMNMWFRARPIDSEAEFEGAINAATESGKEWFSQSHTNILLESPVYGERNGMPFVSVKGAGVSKETGEAVAFAVAFASMPNGALAQLWSIMPASEKKGRKRFDKVIDSFKPL